MTVLWPQWHGASPCFLLLLLLHVHQKHFITSVLWRMWNCFGRENVKFLKCGWTENNRTSTLWAFRLIGRGRDLESLHSRSTFLLKVLNIMQGCLREAFCGTSKWPVEPSQGLPHYLLKRFFSFLAVMSRTGWCWGLITVQRLLEFWCQLNASITAQGHI